MKDHPVMERLLVLRTYLEKIKPIDKKLYYQVDKLLNSSNDNTLNEKDASEEEEEDPHKSRPRPSMLTPRATAEKKAVAEDDEGFILAKIQF